MKKEQIKVLLLGLFIVFFTSGCLTSNIKGKNLTLSGGWIYSSDPLGGAIQLASTNVIHFQGLSDNQRTVFRIMPKGRQGYISSSLEVFGTDFNKDGNNWERFILMSNYGPTYLFCTEKSGNQIAKPMVFSAGNRANDNIYLNTNGYVGIFGGGSAPEHPLDVGGDAYFRQAVTISGVTTIGALLKLTPMATPSSPAEGMIYANASDHHLYFYNGSEWQQLDNQKSMESTEAGAQKEPPEKVENTGILLKEETK